MFEVWRYFARRLLWSAADRVVTSPLVRWVWTGSSAHDFDRHLSEYRPTDVETVREMMAGRYLFSARLIDTEGASPFSVAHAHPVWLDELYGFAWLRHFREARDPGERQFARTLVLDWIARYGTFTREVWAPALTARRILNWLRHLPLLFDNATPEEVRRIKAALATQIQSLRVRVVLAVEPTDRLFAAMALVGAAISDGAPEDLARVRIGRLVRELRDQIDADGLHRSRSPRIQFDLLTELVSIRQVLAPFAYEGIGAINETVDRMHRAFAALMLGTGEPAYFNGCGQIPVDMVLAVQSQHAGRIGAGGCVSGYGILHRGRAVVVADGGRVPPLEFAGEAHAGALAFEFSHGSDLLVGNCGPAPAELSDSRDLFRQGAAHSSLTIDHQSSSRILPDGFAAHRLRPAAADVPIELDDTDAALRMKTRAYADGFGVDVERSLSLISEGDTLVGQDRFIAVRPENINGHCTVRFHLGPGVQVEHSDDEAIIHLILKSGARWAFLWEGAEAYLEDSVRQSAFFGFFKTQQIVLETDVRKGGEIAWIFARQHG